jgi:hypothetical protein
VPLPLPKLPPLVVMNAVSPTRTHVKLVCTAPVTAPRASPIAWHTG